jgi:hypothetical protein
MIEIIVKFYGINCENKWIGYFACGLTLSLFSTNIFILIFTEISTNIISEIFIKFCLSITISTKLLNYLIIKGDYLPVRRNPFRRNPFWRKSLRRKTDSAKAYLVKAVSAKKYVFISFN